VPQAWEISTGSGGYYPIGPPKGGITGLGSHVTHLKIELPEEETFDSLHKQVM